MPRVPHSDANAACTALERQRVARLVRRSPADAVCGRDVIPIGMADAAIIEHLADTLTNDQIQTIAGVLKPEQWAPIADRLLRIRKDKIAKAEAKSGNGAS